MDSKFISKTKSSVPAVLLIAMTFFVSFAQKGKEAIRAVDDTHTLDFELIIPSKEYYQPGEGGIHGTLKLLFQEVAFAFAMPYHQFIIYQCLVP